MKYLPGVGEGEDTLSTDDEGGTVEEAKMIATEKKSFLLSFLVQFITVI